MLRKLTSAALAALLLQVFRGGGPQALNGCLFQPRPASAYQAGGHASFRPALPFQAGGRPHLLLNLLPAVPSP